MTTSLRRNVLSSLTILVVLGSLMRERQITNVFQTNYTGGGRAKRSLSSSSHNLYKQQEEHKTHASSSSAQTKKQQSDDIHSRHVTVLPLQDWEQASLRGLYQAQQEPFAKDQQQMANDSCQPPKGIPKACCLGTFAGMGRIIHNRRHQCDPSALEQLLITTTNKNDDKCHVCALLEQLHQTNQTMAFVGDSMSHQIFQGLLCEFYRRNYQIHETTFHFPLATTKQRGGGSARGKQQQPRKETTTTTTEDGHVHVSLPEPTNRRCHGGNSINHCLHMMRRVQITSPTLPLLNVTLQFFHQYRLPFADPQQEQMVLTAADILVVNFGLHWGANYNNDGILATTNMTTTKDKRRHRPKRTQESRMLTAPDNPPTPGHLQNTLAAFLQTAKQSSSRIWIRETSMQHFNADGGDYSFVKHRATKRQQRQAQAASSSVRVERSPVQCVPYFRANTTTTTTTAGWRERAIQEAARQANYSVLRLEEEVVSDNNNQRFDSDDAAVTILPFADWTKPLYALHPYDDRGGTGGGGGGDCTHYCSSPFLYLPLWKSMQHAMSSQEAGV